MESMRKFRGPNMTDLSKETSLSIKELKEQGLDPKDYYWPFNGLKPDGSLFGMDMGSWVSWASAIHPEYVDEETGAPLLYDFVFTQTDEEIMGVEGLAGTVMVTIIPSIDNNTSYAHVARQAATRYPANPKVAARFSVLAELFAEKGM